MEWTLWVLAGFGTFVLLIIASFTTSFLIHSYLETRRDNKRIDDQVVGMEFYRIRLEGDSHWFGEHKPTAQLLKDLARFEVAYARQIWRESMKGKQTP